MKEKYLWNIGCSYFEKFCRNKVLIFSLDRMVDFVCDDL